MKSLLALGALTLTILAAGAAAEVLHPRTTGAATSRFRLQSTRGEFASAWFSRDFTPAPWVGRYNAGWSHPAFFGAIEPDELFHFNDPASTPEPSGLSVLLGGLFAAGVVTVRKPRLWLSDRDR